MIGTIDLRVWLCLGGLGLGALLAPAACSFPNPDHCWNALGDQTCEQLYQGTRPYCSTDAAPCGVVADYGCVTEMPVRSCWSPCGGGLSALNCSPGESDSETSAETDDRSTYSTDTSMDSTDTSAMDTSTESSGTG